MTAIRIRHIWRGEFTQNTDTASLIAVTRDVDPRHGLAIRRRKRPVAIGQFCRRTAKRRRRNPLALCDQFIKGNFYR